MKINILENQITISDDDVSVTMDFIEPINSSKIDWYLEDLKIQFIEKKQQIELLKTTNNVKIQLTYAEMRRLEYPPIEEQLDMLYWDLIHGTSNWKDKINQIKLKHPKPDLK